MRTQKTTVTITCDICKRSVVEPEHDVLPKTHNYQKFVITTGWQVIAGPTEYDEREVNICPDCLPRFTRELLKVVYTDCKVGRALAKRLKLDHITQYIRMED